MYIDVAKRSALSKRKAIFIKYVLRHYSLYDNLIGGLLPAVLVGAVAGLNDLVVDFGSGFLPPKRLCNCDLFKPVIPFS